MLIDPDRALVLTVDFSSPAYLQAAADTRCGSLPAFAYQPNGYRAVTERALPFQVRMESSIRLTAIITLPDACKVISLPDPVQYDGLLGHFADSAVTDGRTLTYTCELATKYGTFPATALDAVKAWAGILALEKRNGLQFYVTK